MSIPMRHGGDSKPTITMKQARPRASPHCRSKCWVLPAIWSGLPCAPCTVPFKWLQGPPLGVVAPPDGESKACHRCSSVHKAEDGDAFKSQLAGDGWAYCTPNRGHLGLR